MRLRWVTRYRYWSKCQKCGCPKHQHEGLLPYAVLIEFCSGYVGEKIEEKRKFVRYFT